MLRALAFGIASAAILSIVPASVSGQDVDRALSRAQRAIREGEPEVAIEILERVQSASTEPAIDHELYLAHEQAGHPALAADHLEAYLDADPEIDPEERRALVRHLRLLRSRESPMSLPARDDEVIAVLGWAQLGAGIGGIVLFLGAAGVALALENRLSEDCRNEASLCMPGERDPISAAWTISMTGLGAGVVLGALGAAYLVVSGQAQRGSARSLPPDLDPSMQRPNPFSLAPWMDGNGGGLRARLVF